MGDSTECLRCGRVIKDKRSIKRSYGPVCYAKYLQELEDKSLAENTDSTFVEEEAR